MNQHYECRNDDWAVWADILSDGSKTYHVYGINECTRIEAINLESAIRIMDCLAENTA